MTNMNLVIRFWKIIDDGTFSFLAEVLSDKVIVHLKNTNETLNGAKEYIDFNKNYPGKWNAKIECLYEVNDGAISIVKVTNSEGKSYYAISVFKINVGMITEIKEYWGENTDIPQWRVEQLKK